ncbi:MAG: hypothetical protein LBU60_05310 [Clostridiales bacterium]|jgi:hypothetical protein|nr:hypothetical protein [Clostridiales bacterium]
MQDQNITQNSQPKVSSATQNETLDLQENINKKVKKDYQWAKVRPIRLLILIFLASIFFVIGSTINRSNVDIWVLQQNNLRNLTIASVGGDNKSFLEGSLSESLGVGVGSRDIENLENITNTKHLKIIKSPNSDAIINLSDFIGIDYNVLWDLKPYFLPLLVGGVTSLLEVANEQQAGLTKIAGRLPVNHEEIAISDWVADLFITYNWRLITDIPIQQDGKLDFAALLSIMDMPEINKIIDKADDLLGLQLKTTISPPLTIVGVYSTDIGMDRFDKFKEQTSDEMLAILAMIQMSALADTTVGMGFVAEGFTQTTSFADKAPSRIMLRLNGNLDTTRQVFNYLQSTKRIDENNKVTMLLALTELAPLLNVTEGIVNLVGNVFVQVSIFIFACAVLSFLISFIKALVKGNKKTFAVFLLESLLVFLGIIIISSIIITVASSLLNNKVANNVIIVPNVFLVFSTYGIIPLILLLVPLTFIKVLIKNNKKL